MEDAGGGVMGESECSLYGKAFGTELGEGEDVG